MGLTTNPDDPRLRVTESSGQHQVYLVLSDEERAQGFVRPVRRSYRHVGIPGPINPLRELTEDEHTRYDRYNYVRFEQYSEAESSVVGRYWTQAQLDTIGKGCGGVTTMGQVIAETYARNPHFYGATFCVRCGKHLPVGAQGEFVWEGSDERVGT